MRLNSPRDPFGRVDERRSTAKKMQFAAHIYRLVEEKADIVTDLILGGSMITSVLVQSSGAGT
jgi:hypothetical protein